MMMLGEEIDNAHLCNSTDYYALRTPPDGDDDTGTNRSLISSTLRHVLIVLTALGLYSSSSSRLKCRLLLLLTTLIGIINMLLFVYTTNIFLNHRRRFGMLHASTVSAAITGIKPLIASFVILIFFVNFKSHRRLLRQLDDIDLSFRSAFRVRAGSIISPNVRLYAIVFLILTIVSFAIPLQLRVIEFWSMGERIGARWLADVSLILVPLLSVYHIVPLIYYDIMNRIVRFWCRKLVRSIRNENRVRCYSLSFYYRQFLKITQLQQSIGDLFNPFVFVALGSSVFCLCLTIYFITQPTSSLLDPLPLSTDKNVYRNRSSTHYQLLQKIVGFNLCWSGLQVLVAITSILAICTTGTKTNEQTRQILTAVLAIDPDLISEQDRFQISCFMNKILTQYMWGITVWRAFPLERGAFLTFISIIVSYSFLLLKLKDNQLSKSDN